MAGPRQLDVVAGVLCAADGRVLIAERLGDTPFAGLWEFPGGKIRRGESPVDALRRELAEEIGICAGDCRLLTRHAYQYPDRHVRIAFYAVRDWHGEPTGCEGQRLRWCKPSKIDHAELLPANGPVLDLLQRRTAVGD